MLDQSTRTAILRLREQGHGTRAIAKALGISRGAVIEVIRSGRAAAGRIDRGRKAEHWRDEILALHAQCKGNLVRVHEELLALGAAVSYSALTAFCRVAQIGHAPKLPAGQYVFAPGEEMQHDTSPHQAEIGGRLRRVQTASLVLCFSRLWFFQLYPSFDRFACKIFLTDAARYVGGVCARCMIDNTHVIVLRGTGADMVPVPEMVAFADRLGFAFEAHEKGDANRSARVERRFWHIETNFLAGRSFTDWADANRQAAEWCDRINARYQRRLHASPRELFAAERPALRALPDWLPEVYVLHQRIVDVEGYVSIHRNRYSVPYDWIGRRVEVRETKERIDLYDGPRVLASHERRIDARDERITDPTHRPARGQGARRRLVDEEREALLAKEPELADYVAALQRRAHGPGLLPVRKLRNMLRDYPRDALLAAVRLAHHYGMHDLERLERMVLRNVADRFFPRPTDDPEDDDDR